MNVGLITKHHKRQYIQASLSAALDWQILELSDFDTDLLGTFSGEVERIESPESCAIQKAQRALAFEDVSLGLGSEGSFSPDQWGMMTINQELLACVDRNNKVLAIGIASQPVHVENCLVKVSELAAKDTEIESFIASLPSGQGVIIAELDEEKQVIKAKKGLTDSQQIHSALAEIAANPSGSLLELSYDLRAMQCPQRQQTIAAAATDLAGRLKALCPQCQSPNFVAKRTVSGLPCELCHQPTGQTIANINHCDHCGFEQQEAVAHASASAVHCPFCNP